MQVPMAAIRRKLQTELESTVRAPLTPAMIALLAQINEAERKRKRGKAKANDRRNAGR